MRRVSFAPYVLAALILLAAHLRDLRRDAREDTVIALHDDERREWVRERQELLTRIQAPAMIPRPLPAAGEAPVEPPEDDEWDLVGTIAVGAEA